MALCGTVILPSCANDLPSPVTGEIYFNTTDSSVKVFAGPNAVAPGWYAWETENVGGLAFACGGTEFYNGDGYVCHVFETSGTICWLQKRCYQLFMIGGGGGGGFNIGGGGGGAGAYHYCTAPGSLCCTFIILDNPFTNETCYGVNCIFSPPQNNNVTVGGGGGGATSIPVSSSCGGYSAIETFNVAGNILSCICTTRHGGGGVTEIGCCQGNGGASGCNPPAGFTPSLYPNGGCGSPQSCPGVLRASGGGGGWGLEGAGGRDCACLNSPAPVYGGTGTCSASSPLLPGYCFGGGGAGTSHCGAAQPSPTIGSCHDARRTCVWGGGCGGCGKIPFGYVGGHAKGAPYYGGGGGAGSYNKAGGNGSSGVVIIRYCCCSSSPGV